jgi:hypothetical protein
VPGPISLTLGTSASTGYIIQAGGTNSWGPVSVSGGQVTAGMGPRFYLAGSCATSFSPSVFSLVKLLGESISFTVDLNKVGCGQNAAFYLVGMPAGSAGSNGDYYCDANCVGGSCCTEMDLMEANRHALQITPHRCTGATSGCDGGGCAVNSQSISNGYGPSSSYTINTQNPFNVEISFITSGGQLSQITSVISQGSNSITLTHSNSNCASGYLAGMTTAFETGLVPVWSFWSGSMSWLDSPACSSDSSDVSSPSFVFSNLVIGGTVTSYNPPPPPPPAAPGTIACGSSGCTINQYWVEFTPPSGVSGASTSASVVCTGATFPCTWFSSGSKYQCNCGGGNGCTNPVPQVNGAACPIGGASNNPPPPPPPAALACGSSGCTTNQYWVEFTPPSGVSGSSTSASVVCSQGTYSCTWFSGGSKYQCNCGGGNGCTNPVPQVNGVACPIGSAILDDSAASPLSGSNTGMIIGIVVGVVVVVIVIVVLIVVLVRRNKLAEQY